MKKFWVSIVFIITSLFVFAQIAEFPQYEFKSTTNYQYTITTRQYTIPIAAYDIQNSNSQKSRKISYSDERPGYDPADPNWENTPIGDAILPLLVISLIYCLFRLFKHYIIQFL